MPERSIVPMLAALTGAAFLFSAGGCHGDLALRQSAMEKAQPYGFSERRIAHDPFRLLILIRDRSRNAETLTIYIEGDGAQWSSPYHAPRDPTPVASPVLAMAIADPAGSVAYLGRPCQYLSAADRTNCDPAYWDERRFSPEVIDAYGHVVDALKSETQTTNLRLVGYSGGGVIATLLAARRDDVEELITVAAPLAVNRWTHSQGISPLIGSVDPISALTAPLSRATHWTGGRDKIVPPEVVAEFAAKWGGNVRLMPDFTHSCCWAEQWRQLLEENR